MGEAATYVLILGTVRLVRFFQMLDKKKNKTFTEGPLFWRILLFAFPIIFTGLLQTFYTIADNIVVGQFSGDPNALGAVGSTGSTGAFILNTIIGISGGAGVIVSHYFGAKENEKVSRAVHTALSFSLIYGLALGALGFILARPVLTLIGTKPEYLENAVLYLRIISLGFPASSICNFSAAILRSIGDSKSPMIILSSTGLLNVAFNLFFVIVCGMSVAGVALATIISQYASVVFMIIAIARKKNSGFSFSPSKLRIDRAELGRILRIGLPSGVQASLFSFANIVLTNGVNTFPASAITAYTIANNIDNVTYKFISGFQHATMTFVGQNFGAKRLDRIKKVLIYSTIQVTFFSILVGQAELFFGEQLCALYIDSNDPAREEITRHVLDMIQMFLSTYFICGIMDTLSGTLKGLGYAVTPMVLALTGACGFRILWRFTIFPTFFSETPIGLLICFPLSWIITLSMFAVALFIVWRRLKASGEFSTDNLKETINVQ